MVSIGIGENRQARGVVSGEAVTHPVRVGVRRRRPEVPQSTRLRKPQVFADAPGRAVGARGLIVGKIAVHH